MSRELKQTISGAVGVAGRSAAEVAVKTGRAEVEAATKRLAEAKASLVEANSRASAGGLDRERSAKRCLPSSSRAARRKRRGGAGKVQGGARRARGRG